MAYPLSSSSTSSIISPSFTHSFLNKSFFLHTHLRLSLRSPTPIYATLTPIPPIATKKNNASSMELTKRQTAPSILLTHLESTVKQFQSLMAVFFICIEIASPVPLYGWQHFSISPAEAVLYSPETKTLPRTGELALRRAIPANTNMKTIQDSLEDISYLLRIPQRKPFGTMEGNVKKALQIATDEKASILASLPAELKEEGSVLYTSLIDGKGGLQKLLQYIKDKDPDKVSVCLASTLDTVAQLELLQAPGLSFLLPEQYLKYPREDQLHIWKPPSCMLSCGQPCIMYICLIKACCFS